MKSRTHTHTGPRPHLPSAHPRKRMTSRLRAAPMPGPQAGAWKSASDVLARTIYGEARGELVRGKEAVACVVINRVRRARMQGGHWWGNDVESVCKKPRQFSCWNENDPNRAKILAVTADDPVFQTCQRIARRACAGAVRDLTGGAVHYHACGVSPRWAEGHTPSARIGGHVFYNTVE